MKIKFYKGLPIIGYLFPYLKNRLNFLLELRNKSCSVFKLKIGPRVVTVVNDPLILESMFTKNQHLFEKRINMDLLFGKNSIFVTNGQEWKKRRRITQNVFNFNYLNEVAETISKLTYDALDEYNKIKPADLEVFFSRLTFNINMKCIVGLDLDQNFDLIYDNSSKILTYLADKNYNFFGQLFKKKEKEFASYILELDTVIYSAIDKAILDDKGDSYLNVLVRHLQKEGESLNKQEIRDNIVTMIFAGFETTSQTLCGLFYALSQSADELEASYREIKAYDGELNTFKKVKEELPILDNIISEGLRLYTPAWAFTRNAIEDVKVGNYLFQKGETVLVSPYLMHRDPKLWDSPLEFRSARFAEVPVRKQNRFIYMPFGVGQRVCVGMQFALLELKLVTYQILKNYKVVKSGEAPIFDAGTTTFSRNGYNLKLIKR